MSTFKKIALTLLAVALPCFAWADAVYANTLAESETLGYNTWTATTATDGKYLWSTDTNWSSGSVPEPGATVCILANGTNGDTLTMDVQATPTTVYIIGTQKLTITGTKELKALDNIIAQTDVDVSVTAINSDNSLLMTIEDGVTATFDSGTGEIGRTMAFTGSGTFAKTGSGIFNVFAYAEPNGVDLTTLFNGVTVDVQDGTLNLTRWPSSKDTIKVNNLVATIAPDATLGAPNGVTCNGATTITVASGTATAFTSNQTVTLNGALTKFGAGTLTIPGILAGSEALNVNEGTLTLTGANTYTGGTTINDGATLVLNGANDKTAVLNNGSSVTVNEGGIIELNKGLTYVKISGAGTTKVTGTEFVYGMSGNLSRGLETATIEVDNGAVLKFRTWTNAYTIEGTTNLIVNGTIQDEGYSGATNTSISLPATGTLSGTGTISIPVTLASGATIDATNGALTVDGTVTIDEGVTVAVTLPENPAVGTKVITCGTAENATAVAAKLTNDTYAFTANGTTVQVAAVCTDAIATPYASVQQAVNECVRLGMVNVTIYLSANVEENVQLPSGCSGLTFANFGGTSFTYSGTVTDVYGNTLTPGDDGSYTTPDYTVSATVGGETKKYATLNGAVADDATVITLLKDSVITENLTLNKCISGAYKLTVKRGVTFTVNAPAYDGTDNTKTFADYTTIETEEDAVVELMSGGGYFSVTGIGTTKVLGDIRYGLGHSGSKTNTISTDLEVAESKTLTLRAWNYCAPLGGGNISVNGRIVAERVDNNSTDATITIASDKTLSGKGTIGTTDSGYKAVNVTLADGAILDASEGPITVMGSNSSVSFPEPTDEGGLVSPGIVNVILPEGTIGFPARFIYCTGATEATAQEVSVGVKLKGEERFLYNDEIVLMVNNTTGRPDGYGVMQYVCIGDGVKYMSVTEAVAAGAKAITLQEDTIENVAIPNGVTLELSDPISGTHTITGDVTIKDGATLVPLGGSINGNLVFEDNSRLTLSMEFDAGEGFPFTVTGTVTFPTANFTITADTSAETVKLGVPRQLIKSGMLLTPGTVYTITNLDVITGGTKVPTNENTKIVTTSTTYELVTTETSAYTFDGVDYVSIEQALEEYKTAMKAGIPNNQTIKLNNVLMPTETIVVDVGEGNTVTFDLTNSGIASYADPAIRIVSGNLALVNNTTTAKPTTVASMVGKAILVGAALENDVVTASDTACGLYIGSYVTVSTENTTAPVVTVDVINGGISGEGVISGNLTLADGSIVDATHGVLTATSVTFPKEAVVVGETTTYVSNTIKVMPLAGEPYPSRFIICPTATTDAIENVNVTVILNGKEMTDVAFKLTRKRDAENNVTGYAVMGDDIVAISINDSVVKSWGQLSDAVEEATATGQVILTADATIANDYETNIYTGGHNITLAENRTLTGTLTLMHGTVVTVPDDVTLTATNIIIDTNAVVTIDGTIASDDPVVNNGTITTSTPMTMAKIEGTLQLADGSVTNGMVSATVGTIVDAGAKATVNGYLYGSLTVQNATVDGEGYILIADPSTWAGKTLAGAGTINPTVRLYNGATINKVGYEAAHLVMPKLEALSSEKITVKANDLAHVINTKDTVINAANFTVDMTGSNYVAYNANDPQAEDTDLVAPVVAVNNGDHTLGIVKINYNLVGVDIKTAGYAQSLAAFAYSYGVLEVMGVYNNREAFQCFSNLSITGFTTGGYANIGDYDFGVTDITVTTETTVTGEGDNAVTTTTPNYVIVTAQVLNTDGTADFRGTTNVVVNVNGTAVEDAVELTAENATTYGLEYTEQPGVKFLLVPYASVITGEMTDGSKTAKITVKAVSAITAE